MYPSKALSLVRVTCCIGLLLSVVPALGKSPGAAFGEASPGIQVPIDELLAAQADAESFQFPLSSYSSPDPNSGLDFGDERAGGVYHLGEDVHAEGGTSVFATANGEVKLARSATDFQGVVIIEHRLPDGGYVCSIAGHLEPSSLHALGPVSRGEQIGIIAEGDEAHLHFGIRKGPYSAWPITDWGRTTDPAVLDDWWDPTDFVKAHSGQEPSSDRFAYIGSDGNIWMMKADGGEQRQLTYQGGVSVFAWAPDGRRIAFARPNYDTNSQPYTDLVVADLIGNQEVLLYKDIEASIWSIAWAPDGTRLALLSCAWLDETWRVVQVEVGSGRSTTLVTSSAYGMGVGFPFVTSGVAWSPDGEFILVYAYPSRTEVLRLADGNVTSTRVLSDPDSPEALMKRECLCPRWSPDGTRIACHDFESILVVDLEGNMLQEYGMAEDGWGSPAWSPDGSKIATGGPDGVWVIDTHTSKKSQLVTQEAWEPSWSADSQQIVFSLVSGLGSEGQEVQGIGIIKADGTDLRVLDDESGMPVWQPDQIPTEPRCGVWNGIVTDNDNRIELTRVSQASGSECRGAFLFSNNTGIWGLGGYSLELQAVGSENATAAWLALQNPEEGTESTFLLPSLDMELHTFPVDRYTAARVLVKGEMTLASVTADTALFLLKTALTLTPGGSCVVPEEQVAYASLRLSHIIAPAAQLVMEGDLKGAREELQQLLPDFLDRGAAVLKMMGVDCGAEALKALIGKPGVILKLVVAYLTWVPVAIYDYFEYQGRPTHATLVYEVSPAATPIPTTAPSEEVLIPSGEFQMGCDRSNRAEWCSSSAEGTLHPVYLDSYFIYKYEVTNSQYSQCVNAGVCEAPEKVSSATRASYFGDPAYGEYPAIYVSWDDATDYCARVGKRLPTAAEWEKAARGTNDTRAYPWGNDNPVCLFVNSDQGPFTAVDVGASDLCVADTSAVGSYPRGASPYGVMDLAGNVSEWVADWYQADQTSVSPDSNPRGPATGTHKLIYGGGWFSRWHWVSITHPRVGTPDVRSADLGFRCARSAGK